MNHRSIIRSWASVHATTTALSMIAITVVAVLIFGRSTISSIGPVRFLAPISTLLLFPAIAGVAAAVACENRARLPLPNPPRAVVARLAWATGWMVLASLAVNIGQVGGSELAWTVSTRNVVVYATLGILVVTMGFAHLVWLPSLVLTLASMVFGYPPGEFRFYWWAVVMEPGVTRTQLVAVSLVFALVVLIYALRGAPHRTVDEIQ